MSVLELKLRFPETQGAVLSLKKHIERFAYFLDSHTKKFKLITVLLVKFLAFLNYALWNSLLVLTIILLAGLGEG